jgi:ribonucleotide reductase alpha subunit
MLDKIISDEYAATYKNEQPNWGFNGLGYIVFKRTYARLKENGETEEWHETVQRCINGAQKIGADYTTNEAERLFDLIFNLKCNFAGRMLWQLGAPTVDRFGANSLLNCWFTQMNHPKSFKFLFENLMLGGGVGFSVRREDIHELPRIKKDVKIYHDEVNGKATKDADFIVPDSREGWIELLGKVLDSYFYSGKSFSYSTVLVRGAGELIRGFGGSASGPSILIDGITKISNVFKTREGKKLRSVDVLDINNIIGSIVVAGNVRRSAEIAIGDPDDFLFLRAKRWDLGGVPNYRAMSNNTIYCDSYEHTSDALWEGYNGNGEPYGLFNLPLSEKYGRLSDGLMKKSDLYPENKDNAVGTNPCQPAWAPILTKGGIRKVEEIQVGDFIWSKDGWTKVVKKWSSGVKPVYKYTTTGSRFYGTENHRLVSMGEKKEAKDCQSIDSITGPFLSDFTLSPQDIVDGLVVGDGMIHKASGNLKLLCIGENDKDYFDSEISKYIGKRRDGIAEISDRIIPDRFYRGGANVVCSFLRGLFSANGSVCGNRVTLKSSSLRLIEQVQDMLSSVGIRSYFTTNKPSLVKFSNGECLCKASYDLNISTDREKFISNIGFIQEYKNERVKIVKSSRVKETFDIISVEKISEEEVFDFTVDNESHTYWTSASNVSNCGEISLGNFECCNLSELYLNNIETKEEALECAILLNKTQKAICAMPFIHEETNEIVHKNMRIGLGVTGICQSMDKLGWLDYVYKGLRKFDYQNSKERGWNPSIKLTTVKPSGTLSILAGSTPGVHPAFSSYFIRRIRMAANDSLVEICRDLGYHTEFARNFDGSENHDTIVIEFPCKFENALLAKDTTAIKQLELIKELQANWSDNAVSCTVYYKKEELSEIKEWLKANYKDNIKSVSFLLHSDHGFTQAPYEEIDEVQYEKMIKKVKPLVKIDTSNEMIDGIECEGGVCPIR